MAVLAAFELLPGDLATRAHNPMLLRQEKWRTTYNVSPQNIRKQKSCEKFEPG